MYSQPRTQCPRKTPNVLLACLVACAAMLAMLTSVVTFATSASAMTSTEQSYANAMLKQFNAERAANHLKALTVSTKLVSSAHTHNLAMAKANLMSHQETGEAVFTTRITRTGYKWTRVGENIGWTTAISSSGLLHLQSQMYAEKAPDNGHRLNILNKYYKNVGIDVYIDTKHHKVWFTQDLGTPA